MAIISDNGLLIFSCAALTTSKARVESKPPEIPITDFLEWVCSSLLDRAED